MVTESQLRKAHMNVDDALEDLSAHSDEENYFATKAVCRAIQAAGYQIAHAIGQGVKEHDSRTS